MLAAVILAVTAAFVPARAQNPSNLEWRTWKGEHFDLYYPVGQEMTAFEALEVARKVREPLEKMYGPVDGKVAIVVKDTEDFASGGAFFYDNKIEISATNLDFGFRSYGDWLWNVVTHELSHIYSIRPAMKAPRWLPMAYYQHIDYQEEKREDVLVGYPNIIASYPIPMFNVPGWLAEGAAQYNARGAKYDRWDAHRDMIVRQASLNDGMLSLTEMTAFNWTGRENEMVYNHGYALIRYIGERYGDDAISGLMHAMGDPAALTFDAACERVLGTSQEQLYDEWIASLKSRYEALRDSLGTRVEGRPFRTAGYVNGFPSWSPDGSRLAYVSNKGQDYGITACFIADLSPGGWQWEDKDEDEEKQREKLEKSLAGIEDPVKREEARQASEGAFDIALAGGIQTAPVWLDEWNILYNRRMPSDRYGSHWWDIYRYVINREDPREGTRTRISHSLRSTYPDLSPDMRKLVFVRNGAGRNNLFVMDRDDNSLTQLTHYDDGTRVYRPRWSPDGSKIAFTVHRRNTVNIATINADGTGFACVVASSGQDRDPDWTNDSSSIVFSSDVTGIPNLYRLSMEDGAVYRLTNVIGGAFQPAVSPGDSTIAFSYYSKDGYEIRLLSMGDETPVPDSSVFHGARTLARAESTPADWPVDESERYRMETLDFSFMPLIRNDQGNLKLGTYVVKNEMVDQGTFLFAGAISPTNRETDLFARFTYRRFIPDVFVEMYRLTRNVERDENFMEEYGTVIRKRVYDLNEIDFGVRYTHRDQHEFESRLIYSQYNAKIEYTHFLTGPQLHKPYYTYSRGFDWEFSYRYDRYMRTIDEVINPRGGRKVHFRYDRVLNFFLDDFEYVGFLREKYKRYPYSRFYLNWQERIPVPHTEKHTLCLRGMFNIIDRQVDDFYENQLGGPSQMRGYTFYSLSGRKNVMAQALYRFPAWRDIRKKFGPWHLNNIYMSLFSDIGRAWNKRELNWSTEGFKRDGGAELRIDLTSFYNFPTMLEFSAAYGPDDTWIRHFDEETSKTYWKKDEQDPWKFYFSVLFGFM